MSDEQDKKTTAAEPGAKSIEEVFMLTVLKLAYAKEGGFTSPNYDDLAAALGTTKGAAAKRWSRFLPKLREGIKPGSVVASPAKPAGTPKRKAVTPKRKASDLVEGDEGIETATPTKRKRATNATPKKAAKVAEVDAQKLLEDEEEEALQVESENGGDRGYGSVSGMSGCT